MYKIEFLDIEENDEYEKTISKVLEECFKVENLPEDKLLVSITLTNPENIRKLNNEYRNIDKSTDVLSFPMFEKEEIDNMVKNAIWDYNDILGDMVISIEQVEKQAVEYGHSFKREICFLAVHGFLHLLGYDHMEKEEEKVMFARQELILNETGITK